jgi:hypothetical protein
VFQEQRLDYASQLLDNFLNELENIPLKERISINKYGTASTVVEPKIKELTTDAKKTISLAKNLYKQVMDSKRQVVTGRFLKFFRLISENSKKVSTTMSRLLSDTTWLSRIPGQVIKKGIVAIEYFRRSINQVIEELNERIMDKNEKIALVPSVQWKAVRANDEQRFHKQMEIKHRNFSLFESIYKKAKL